MKQNACVLACSLLVSSSLCLSTPLLTQSAYGQRAIGTQALVLDDGLTPAHTMTLTYPGPGPGPATNYNFTFPSFSGTLVPIGTTNGDMLRWDGTSSAWQASSVLRNTGTKIGLGIDPASSTVSLDVLGTATSGNLISTNILMNGTPAAPASFGNYYGVNAESRINGTNSLTGSANAVGVAGRGTSYQPSGTTLAFASGVVGSAENNNSGTVTYARGLSGQIVNNSTGTVTTAVGAEGDIFNQGTGTITNAYGLRSGVVSNFGGGTITNLYGIYIDPITAGTNNTAMLYDNSSNPFVIKGDGRVGIGTTTMAADRLTVSGNSTSNTQTIGTSFKHALAPAGSNLQNNFATVSELDLNDGGSMASGRATGFIGEAFSNRTGANTVSQITGVAGDGINASTATITRAVGVNGEVVNQGGGTVTTAIGINGTIFAISGSITNSYSVYAMSPQNLGGTITNAYGLFIEPITAGTTRIPFLFNHATSPVAITNNGQLGIGTTTPATGASLHVATTDAMIVPVGTTAQRPTTPVQGMIRFNTTTVKFEGYDGTVWSNLN